jgi:ABC-type Mn2+/Zn2+ transport system ATPase subunit
MAQLVDKSSLAIEASGISYSYSRPYLEALRDIDLAIPRGTFTAVMGPNGSGKSTLLRLILGLLKPSSGYVRVFGESPEDSAAIVQRSVGYVPQYDSVNLRLPIRSRDVLGLGIRARSPSRTSEWVAQRVDQTLDQLGLLDLRDRRYGALSGGQRQRVLLARAMALDPEVLVLDEPFSAMDMASQRFTAELLHDLVRNQGKTVLTVAHSIHTIVHFLDCLVLLNGELVASGAPDTVLRPANLIRAYGADVPVVICEEGYRHPLMEDSHV